MKIKGKALIIVILVALLTVLFVLILGTWQKAPSVPENNLITDVEIDSKNVQEVVQGNNQFALDLYQRYSANEGENIFFSPYSIVTALAMTYEGAREETAEEMQQVFHFPSEEVRLPGFAGLYNAFNQPQSKYILKTANALWPEQDYHFLEEYFGTIEKYYRGKVSLLDFRTQAEESRLTINNWVEGQTQEKIKDLIPTGFIDPDTRLVLTNAIYFKGDWLEQFDPDRTTDQDFYIDEEESVSVPMMSRFEAEVNYGEIDDVQILSLPYQGEDLRMLVLLPGLGQLNELEESLTLDKLDEYRSALELQDIDLFLPRFKVETKYFMEDDLAQMGMPLAFSALADFSGMTGEKDLYISHVIHQAFVEVNEEGTEAAAATAVIMEEIASMVVPVFQADRPFVFMIEHQETGSILFIGRVSDPS